MKKSFNKLFSLSLVISFLYVQVPFAAFHHHDHKPVCELNDHATAHKPIDDSKKHFHANVNSPCFLCSAHLLKEYQVKEHAFSFAVTVVHTPYTHSAPQLASSFIYSSSSRAPPILA